MSINQCRICLNEDVILKNVFQTEIQVNDKKSLRLREIFKAVTNITIYNGDLFPETICELCISELTKAYRIRIQAKKSDFILRKNLSTQLVKSEMKSDNFDDENQLSKSLDDFEMEIFNDCDEEDSVTSVNVKKEEEIEEVVCDVDEKRETTLTPPTKIMEVDIDEQLADYPEVHYSDSEAEDDVEDTKKMNTVSNIKGKFVCYICDEVR